MLSDLLRWGGKRPGQPDAPGDAPASRGDEPVVPSKAFPKFLSAIAHQPDSPALIDLGPVIGTNVAFFGERLGCKLFIEDLFADYDRHARGGTLEQLPAAIESRFRHADDERGRRPVLGLLRFPVQAGGPGARASRSSGCCGPAAPSWASSARPRPIGRRSRNTRSSTTTPCGTAHHPGAGGPKHVLLNRDIIKMFDGLIVSDSFLLKSNTREILLRRRG